MKGILVLLGVAVGGFYLLGYMHSQAIDAAMTACGPPGGAGYSGPGHTCPGLYNVEQQWAWYTHLFPAL
jgi:hypothetical protein